MTTEITTRVANPDEIEYEMTIKMSLQDWRRLANNINSIAFNPMCHFVGVIRNLLEQADREFCPDKNPESETIRQYMPKRQ